MKRQDPTLEDKLHFQKQYDHRKEQQSFDGVSNTGEDELMLSDQRFTLNSDFYAKKRISHQNKSPYNYVSNYNIDAEDLVRNEDLPDLENDDTAFAQNDDFMYKHYDDYSNDKFVKGHKIVARETSEEFRKNLEDHVRSTDVDNENNDDYEDDKDLIEDNKSSYNLKKNENREFEEIIDIKKEADDVMAIFDGQLDVDSNYTGFLELLGMQCNYFD